MCVCVCISRVMEDFFRVFFTGGNLCVLIDAEREGGGKVRSNYSMWRDREIGGQTDEQTDSK